MRSVKTADELIEAIENAGEGELLVFDEASGSGDRLENEIAEAASDLEDLEHDLVAEDGMEEYRERLTEIRSNLVDTALQEQFK